MLASPESCSLLPSSKPTSPEAHSLSHPPPPVFSWELRLFALSQPLEESAKALGPAINHGLGPYVTLMRQQRIFQSTREGEGGRGVCMGPTSHRSSGEGVPRPWASVTCLHKGSSRPLGMLGEYNPTHSWENITQATSLSSRRSGTPRPGEDVFQR